MIYNFNVVKNHESDNNSTSAETTQEISRMLEQLGL
jgi:hypothetical protein